MKTEFCVACGATEHLHQHHLLPKAVGGGDEPTNMITLCVACHGKIHGCIWQPIHKMKRPYHRETSSIIGFKYVEWYNKFWPAFLQAMEGANSCREIAENLNAAGITTASGVSWDRMKVARQLRRHSMSSPYEAPRRAERQPRRKKALTPETAARYAVWVNRYKTWAGNNFPGTKHNEVHVIKGYIASIQPKHRNVAQAAITRWLFEAGTPTKLRTKKPRRVTAGESQGDGSQGTV